MKVGDLVRHPLSGDIGIIIGQEINAICGDYYTVAFDKGSFLIPKEHLEVISESRRYDNKQN